MREAPGGELCCGTGSVTVLALVCLIIHCPRSLPTGPEIAPVFDAVMSFRVRWKSMHRFKGFMVQATRVLASIRHQAMRVTPEVVGISCLAMPPKS
jgi:hypothetical protein